MVVRHVTGAVSKSGARNINVDTARSMPRTNWPEGGLPREPRRDSLHCLDVMRTRSALKATHIRRVPQVPVGGARDREQTVLRYDTSHTQICRSAFAVAAHNVVPG